MQPDLQSLEITKGEFKRLVGINPYSIYRTKIMQDPDKRKEFLFFNLEEVFRYFMIVFAPIVFIGLIFQLHLFISLFFCLTTAVAFQLKKIKINDKKFLIGIIEDVERYNGAIKAIDINDQLELAGNIGVSIQNRDKVIEAIKLTREDLVRALKTERIIRENQNFITNNQDMFANNLTAVKALQVQEKASEHGRLLNEALQISLSVQEEMKKLQSQH